MELLEEIQLAPKQKVAGSTPAGRTMISNTYKPTRFLRLPKTYPIAKCIFGATCHLKSSSHDSLKNLQG